MKVAILFIVLLCALVAASERSELEMSLGAGVWMPSLFDSDTQLNPGPAFMVSLQIPPSLGNCFIIETGYLSATSDRDNWKGVAGIPLTIGFRTYPYFRKYAGPRGIEPLLGIYGGGILLWDRPDGNQDSKKTGAAVIGAEIGARIMLGGSTFLDLVVSPEWVPAGSALAGDSNKDFSGLKILASIVF